MARSYRRPHQLASLLHCTPAEALQRIRALGIKVADANSLIPNSDLPRVLSALAIMPGAKAQELKKLHKKPKVDPNEAPAKAATLPSESSHPETPVEPRPRVDRTSRRTIIGHLTSGMVCLDSTQVTQIHFHLVEDFRKSRDPIDPPGVRDDNLLKSAVHRVHTALGGESKYPTIPMAAAALLHAIIHNHPFHNGNKRTALVAMLVFLDRNGHVLSVEEDSLFDFLLRIAAHDVAAPGEEQLADREMLEIAKWVHRWSRTLSSANRCLKFHELREILTRYDCTFDHPKRGNRINVLRGHLKTQVAYRNEGTDVEVNTIRKLRKDLHLTDEDGIDSDIFYNAKEQITGFIHRYRHTLDRLAKV